MPIFQFQQKSYKGLASRIAIIAGKGLYPSRSDRIREEKPLGNVFLHFQSHLQYLARLFATGPWVSRKNTALHLTNHAIILSQLLQAPEFLICFGSTG